MNKFVNKASLFLKRNSSTILTCIGAVGVIFTAVTAAKATPKAMELIRQAECDKNEELTNIEKIKIAAPAYIPSILIGGSTIACIFGANALNERQQAALTSAYILLDNTYKEYKNKVIEVLGEESNQKVIQAIVNERYIEQEETFDDGEQLFFDYNSLQFFKSTMDVVQRAEKHVIDIYQVYGYVDLYGYYEILGISGDPTVFEACDIYPYSQGDIEFDHYTMTLDSGEECCVINMMTDPLTNVREIFK